MKIIIEATINTTIVALSVVALAAATYNIDKHTDAGRHYYFFDS